MIEVFCNPIVLLMQTVLLYPLINEWLIKNKSGLRKRLQCMIVWSG